MQLNATHRFHFLPLACFVLASAMTGQLAHAKSAPDFSPDLESPAYWNNHAIAIVEVTVTSGGDHSPIKIIEQFSGGDSWKPPVALSRTDTWFRPRSFSALRTDEDAAKPALQAGDHLLISQSIEKGNPGMVVGVPLADKQIEAQTIATCRAIKQARSDPDMPHAFAQTIKSGDVPAQRFYLNYLLGIDPATLSDNVVNQAANLRADTGADITNRILASSLLDKIHGARSDDWDWLVATLKNEVTLTRDQFSQLLARMVNNHNERRGELIDLLAELGPNPATPVALRQAIARENISGIFDRASPDSAINSKMLDMDMRMLLDSNAGVRANASWTLWFALGSPNDFGQTSWPKCTEQVADALQAAAEKETDAGTRRILMDRVQDVRDKVKKSHPSTSKQP